MNNIYIDLPLSAIAEIGNGFGRLTITSSQWVDIGEKIARMEVAGFAGIEVRFVPLHPKKTDLRVACRRNLTHKETKRVSVLTQNRLLSREYDSAVGSYANAHKQLKEIDLFERRFGKTETSVEERDRLNKKVSELAKERERIKAEWSAVKALLVPNERQFRDTVDTTARLLAEVFPDVYWNAVKFSSSSLYA